MGTTLPPQWISPLSGLKREKSWRRRVEKSLPGCCSQDQLNWNHVSDLKYWNSEAAALYGVTSIPYNFLLDPQGNIIAENIRGSALAATLGKFIR